jgi:hypothetical protein
VADTPARSKTLMATSGRWHGIPIFTLTSDWQLGSRPVEEAVWNSIVPWMVLWLSLYSMIPLTVLAAGRGGKTEVMPMVKAAPSAVAIETTGSEQDLRKQLRVKNGVTELGTARVPFSQAPTGTYGFIDPQPLAMALVTQSPDLIVERGAPGANAFEIHKLADGSGMVVGFIEQDLVAQITPASRPHHIRLALYSNPSEKGRYIAAVPLIKLMVDRMPVRLEPNKPDSPVKFDMDLQGTANRKSVPGTQ